MVHSAGDTGALAWANGVDAAVADKLDSTVASSTYRPILGDPQAVQSNVKYGATTGMTKWATALANVRTKDDKARIFTISDSTGYGYNATGFLGWVDRLTTMLNRVAPTRQGIIYPFYQSVVGEAKRAFITLGAGWTTTAGFGIGGAANLSAPAGTATSADFGPFYCSGFIVYYMRRSNTGTMDIQIDAEAATNVGGTGADAMMSSTIMAATTGNHTLHLKNVATNGVIIMGVEPIYGTGVGQGVYVANGGVPSSETLSWPWSGTTPWQLSQQVYVTTPPDLTIFSIGINDMWNNRLPADFQTRLAALVTLAQTTGSALLVIQPARTDATFTYPWSQYVAAIQAVAVANNCPVVSLPTLIGGDITAQGGIFDAGDHIHWTNEMHYQVARAVYAAIAAA